MTAIINTAKDLYLAMPGAPRVPRDGEGFAMWGDLDGTPHWEFCIAIARAIINAEIARNPEPDWNAAMAAGTSGTL